MKRKADARRAFVLTILGEIPETHSGPPDDSHNDTWFNEKNSTLIRVYQRLESFQGSTGPRYTDPSSKKWHELQSIFHQLGNLWRNRVFFTTTNGKIGFASKRIISGDHICVFFGESHLYVLRDRTGGYSEFVSDAYVDEYIIGKGCEDLLKDKTEVFAIK